MGELPAAGTAVSAVSTPSTGARPSRAGAGGFEDFYAAELPRLVELRATARLTARMRNGPPAPLSEPSEELWAAVRALPPRQAQVAALRFVYDMPLADIAETLSCSVGTVKQHLSRARHSLALSLHLGEEES